jgi:hypothetical protein
MGLTQAKNTGNDPTSAPGTCSKTDAALKAEAFVNSFIKAKKDLLLYPAGNPVVTESIEKALKLSREDCSPENVVELIAEKDRLSVDGIEVGPKDSRIRDFCLSLYKRGIRKILLDPGIPFEQMRSLLETINMKVEEIAEAGGIEKLAKSRGITHAVVEETGELTIVDGHGLSVSDDVLPELEALEDIELAVEQLEIPENFSRMFVRLEEGDLESLKRLRALLRNPEMFARLLEKFAIQLEKLEQEIDPLGRVERLLKILSTIGTAIASLPSDDERAHLLKNLAVSVLGLSANIRTELVSKGLVPHLALKSIESGILSRFPTSQLASALLEDFEMSGGAASLMQSYFGNLELKQTERLALAETIRNSLRESDMLTPEVDAVLTVEEAEPQTAMTPGRKAVSPQDAVPRIEGYPPEKILFRDDERSRLIREMSEEFEAVAADVMVPALLELLSHERAPVSHAALVARARSYMDHFLEERKYESAAILVKGLQTELEQKKQVFSRMQLEPLGNTIEEYLGEQKMGRLIDVFRELNKESPDFERLVKYFDALGAPALAALIRSLETEESRHVRLLICQALAQIGDKAIAAVAENVDHPKWYVVRNAVSILGQTGKPGCVPHLRRALSHEDVRVRKEALRALASIRTDGAVELLCDSLNDGDTSVCKAALGWVAAIEAEQAMPALELLLGDREKWKKDDEVLRLAIEALGSIGSESAAALLEKLSQARSLFRRRKAALIREAAAAALRSVEGE